MIDYFQLISISHHKLNTEDLDRFVIRYDNQDDLKQKLHEFKNAFEIDELLYLSTCNRLLILMFRKESTDYRCINEMLCCINPDLKLDLSNRTEKFVDYYKGEDSIRHLFEVASSLRSLVIGEREIFRQFRTAYVQCKNFGLTGDNIRLLEKCTVTAAKDVYTSTGIGEKPVSIVSLALQNLLSHKPRKNSKILMVGSGETNTTFARFLKKHGFSRITIFNRSLNNARGLSEELGASAFHLSELSEYQDGFDVLICSTSATEPIITTELYRNILGENSSEKILIDLSIPNNIDRNIALNFNATLINIDSLRMLADENLKLRRGNVAASRILINYHLDNFTVMFDQRQIEKAFSKLPVEIKSIKERAIDKVFKNKMDELPEETRQLVIEMLDYMEKKCVAAPIKMAKKLVVK